MAKYLVGPGAENFSEVTLRIVEAADEGTAIYKFLLYFAPTDRLFLDYVGGKSINASIAEQFWMATDEEQEEFRRTATVSTEEEEVKQRARDFFAQAPQYADLYINHYFSDDDELPEGLFPPDMLAYMWLTGDYGDIFAVALDDIEVISD